MMNIKIWTCLYTNVPRSNWSELLPQVCLTSSLSHPKGYRAHPDPISSPAEREYTLWIQTDLQVNKKNFITWLRAHIVSRCVRRRAWYLLKKMIAMKNSASCILSLVWKAIICFTANNAGSLAHFFSIWHRYSITCKCKHTPPQRRQSTNLVFIWAQDPNSYENMIINAASSLFINGLLGNSFIFSLLCSYQFS